MMMVAAEATHSSGTILGAVISFLLYGLGPVALVVYLMGAPGRGRAIKARDAAERDAASATAASAAVAASTATAAATDPPDTGREAAAQAPVAPVGKEA